MDITIDLDDVLLAKAHDLTDLTDLDDLVREALTALIERQELRLNGKTAENH